MLSSKAAACEQEHTGFSPFLPCQCFPCAPLSVVDGIGIHDAVGVEIFRRGAQSCRTAQCLAIPHRGAVSHVRFRGIHPPRIDAVVVFRIEMLVHLLPEQFPRPLRIGIVERTHITGTHPVAYVVLHSLLIHPTLAVQLLVVVGAAVELRPHADHVPAMQLMHLVQHALRVRETRCLKIVAAPFVLLPVVPVLHDVVDGDVAFAELFQRARQLVSRLVAFAALPEPHHPFRIHRRLARQGAVATDDLIHIFARNHIVIHVTAHLAPDAQLSLFLRCARCSHTQSAVAHTAVGLPLNAQRRLLTPFQWHSKLIRVRIPCSAPTLCHHFLATHIHLDVACIVEDELVVARLGSLDAALIHHLRTFQSETLWQILNAALVGLANLGVVG